MGERSPKDRLYWLLQLLKNNQINLSVFCDEFHITYDHDLEYDSLTAEEDKLFEELARTASRFSENADDHFMYPNVYTTSEEILKITSNIFNKLNIV
ncbi:hypothetical protein D3C81_1870360 [compost metagenome]|uniref:Self-protective colicin-like immunity n=1 Tax=Fontibacillus panacisegetis TaxID=670482 RepID=A0A1G7R0I6_9BACL|nr:magnesium and cobalt transport protein CorA [Fontibacillus panacisegetis]SDG03450.1 hypothetical protein SAMN04488542_12414 [Fontibacillus panacisegetis]